MGYTLKIGELDTHYDAEEGHISFQAKGQKNDDAPAFGEPTDYENERWPSYTSWHNACRFCGIEDMFYNKETGLLREHPGCFPITKKHQEIINEALDNFKKKYPNAKAGYSPKINEKEGIYEDKDWPEENSWMTRLLWLKYWIDWALVNCKKPVFYNS